MRDHMTTSEPEPEGNGEWIWVREEKRESKLGVVTVLACGNSDIHTMPEDRKARGDATPAGDDQRMEEAGPARVAYRGKTAGLRRGS